MKFFNKKKENEYTIIIGCGRLGANLANELSNLGENVLILDENKDSFRKLASNFGGLSVIGNGTDLDKLNEIKLGDASTVIAVTDDDNINIMAAQIAKEVFNVKKVIARLYDPDSEMVYKKLGISTICPYVLSVNEIDKLLLNMKESEVSIVNEES